jgi:hypothetical protein
MERGGALARAFNAKEAALDRAEETNGALNARIEALEQTPTSDKQTTLIPSRDSTPRCKLERAVTEGALETARKDLARVMREVMALQRSQAVQEAGAQPRAA